MYSPPGAKCVRGPHVFSAARHSGRVKSAYDFMKPRPHDSAAFPAFRPRPRSSAVYPAGSLSRPGGIFRHSARGNTDRRHIPAVPHVPPACIHLRGQCASEGCMSSLLSGIPDRRSQPMIFRTTGRTSPLLFRRSGRAKPVHDFMKPRQCVLADFLAFRPRQHRSTAYPGGPACTACVSSLPGEVRVRGLHVFSAVRHSGRASQPMIL